MYIYIKLYIISKAKSKQTIFRKYKLSKKKKKKLSLFDVKIVISQLRYNFSFIRYFISSFKKNYC